jgi:flagellar basal-body rod protein FlgB
MGIALRLINPGGSQKGRLYFFVYFVYLYYLTGGVGLSFFRDGTISSLLKGLDAAALRQQVTAHNLANLNTPRFQRSDVSFEDQLLQARQHANSPLAKTHENHFPNQPHDISAQIKTDTTTSRRIDGNNVDIEREMLNMVSNQLRYNAYVQQLNTRYNNWRFVINDGRR